MKKEFIDNLLLSINDLRESVNSIKDRDNISFSFFNDAYSKTESIMRNLREMEVRQIEDMKEEMRKLILFLEDRDKKHDESFHNHDIIEEPKTTSPEEIIKGPLHDYTEPEVNVSDVTMRETNNADLRDVPSKETNKLDDGRLKDNDVKTPSSRKIERNIILPEYRKIEKSDKTETSNGYDNSKKTDNSDNINKTDRIDKTDKTNRLDLEYTSIDNHKIISLNDKIHNDPAVLDLKRGLSLNDRFLFQRELFNNDRYAMNSMMLKLNAFDNFEDVEKYLQDNTSWVFEDKTVIEFLSMLKKGFE